MFRHIIRRLRRAPIPAVGVLLFAAILAAQLCGLQRSNEAEREKYDRTLRTIPVEFSVTNLSATYARDLNIPYWIADVFTQEDGLAPFVSDLQRVCKHSIAGMHQSHTLVGITSLALSDELWPENGTSIFWEEGYGESVFAGNDPVCLVPDAMVASTQAETGEKYVELAFINYNTTPKKAYSCRLRVIGTYRGGDGKAIYCPYPICENVYRELGEPMSVQAIRAALQSNEDLEALRTVSKKWFAEPNPMGEQTPWESGVYKYYPYALDINDDLLQRASATLQNSITVNRICAVLVLSLSTAAGLLIGFLMVRGRKKEIALMRTMGTSNGSIYRGFMLEQMVCFGLGILLGGAYNRWDPAYQMGVLAAGFFLGLLAALPMFLRKNLMTTIKEDD